MPDKVLPLPEGFEEVAPATAATAAPAQGAAPPLPPGFEDATPAAPTADSTAAPAADAPPAKPKVPKAEFDSTLLSMIKGGKASKADILAYTADSGYGEIPNIDEVMKGRAHTPNVVVHADDQGKKNFHQKLGEAIDHISRGGTGPAIIAGALRAPMSVSEGLGQLFLRAQGWATGDEDTARLKQFALNQESTGIDDKIAKDNPYSGAEKVGEFAGAGAEASLLPLGKVSKFVDTVAGMSPKALNIAATVAKRAASGGAFAAVDGSHATPEDQNLAIAAGAILTPLTVPFFEKVAAKLGDKLGQAYAQVWGNGIGKNIYDASGNLTPYGGVLKARLRSINPQLPEEFLDDSLQQLKNINPKVAPADNAIVPDMLAQKNNVPLTGDMKTRNAGGIQDFESMQAGSKGTPQGQQAAIDRNRDIDTAITDNIKAIGTGGSSEDAAGGVSAKLKKAYDDAATNVDAQYAPLNKISIPDVKGVAKIAADVRAQMGRGSYQTMGSTARSYIDRLTSLVENKDGPPTFGDVWKLSKDVNSDLRNATGNDRFQLGQVKTAVDKYFTDAANSGNGITSAAAEQLKIANKANRDFSRTFNQNNVKLRGGSTAVQDTAGKAVQKIVGLTKDAAERGEPINPSQIESAIFGNAKALDSAGSKAAVNTIRRVTKAAPDTVPHIKDMMVNRVIGQMETGLFDKGLNPNKVQSAVKAIVDNNRDLLTASGFTAKDITSLQQNAYLASLKAPPVGAAARGSSAVNRGAAATTAKAVFRHTLSLALGALGYHEAGPIGLLAHPAGELLGKVADDVSRSRLAARVLSSKVPLQPSQAGQRVGSKAGRKTGAAAAQGLASSFVGE